RRHFDSCPQCQARDQEVRLLLLDRAGNVPELPSELVAGRPIKVAAASQKLTFPDDRYLSARLSRTKAGDVWLALEHAQWPAATLVRLTIGLPDDAAKSWTLFAVLHAGAGVAAARVLLADAVVRDET